MKRFVELFRVLGETDSTCDKLSALERYFASAPPRDAAWALYFLAGRKLPRAVTSSQLRLWACAEAGLPDWLLEECYAAAGDLAEAIALLLPAAVAPYEMPLHELVEERLLPLTHLPEPARHDLLARTWRELTPWQRLLWNKLITASFRAGVAQSLVVRALAQRADVPYAVMAHRLAGDWPPTETFYQRLLAVSGPEIDLAQPYPFQLACLLDQEPEALGPTNAWQAEWKWDGIRAQLIHRQGQTLLWSRGEELLTENFPEVAEAAEWLPEGTVLDGEILAWLGEAPLPFENLRRRLSQKNPGPTIRRRAPVCFMVYDLLEVDGVDCRARPLQDRRLRLEQLLARAQHPIQTKTPPSQRPVPSTPMQGELFDLGAWSSLALSEAGPALPVSPFRLSPVLPLASWDNLKDLREQARREGVEGIMLKQRQAPYGTGRERGAWWKWKVPPFHIDAVLIAARPGHGRRTGLYTDYTLGVWDGPQLVPVAKTNSGLTEAEMRLVDAFVRQNIIERHGPVRFIKPELVFELAFEAVQQSRRHKAGLALSFPRLARWRHDKAARDADTLETLRALCGSGPKTIIHHPLFIEE